MKQQTAVEWLIKQIQKGEVAYGMFHVPDQTNVFEQAKQMEKEQILNAFDAGVTDGFVGNGDAYKEQYYNETYGDK